MRVVNLLAINRVSQNNMYSVLATERSNGRRPAGVLYHEIVAVEAHVPLDTQGW